VANQVTLGGLPAPSWPQPSVEHVDATGEVRPAYLSAAATLPFESMHPVRSFPRYRGQRNNPGLWWSATTREHVGFESWLERDRLTLLDFDQDVVAIASQPFRLLWDGENGRRSHVPDFFVRRVDGSAVVVDVRPAARTRPADVAVFTATDRACGQAGWAYRLVHEPDPVLMANVRWLAGYRHPRCHRPAIAAAAGAVYAEAAPLMDGAALLGDPLASLPAVFHLLWCGQLSINLAVPLSDTSLVTVAVR
jgi:hypothetical protein